MLTQIYILSDPLTETPMYIGKTTQGAKRRLSQHLSSELNYNNPKSTWIKSLKAKGLKPVMTVIDYTEDKNWEWLEQYWIVQFKAWGFKLKNLTEGGDGNRNLFNSSETRRKRSISLIGHVVTEETRRKISESHKGKKLSQETKDKLRGCNLGKVASEESKLKKSISVSQFDLNGVFIRNFKSVTEAANVTGFYKGNIASAAGTRLKTYRGFIWKYEDKI